MGNLYTTFYGYASSIHHGDIGGLAAQISTGKFHANIAPSFHAIRDALIMGHQSVIVVIAKVNDAAGLGLALWRRFFAHQSFRSLPFELMNLGATLAYSSSISSMSVWLSCRNSAGSSFRM